MAGVGNIYADEALFRAGIHPLRPAGRLTAAQHERLRDAVVAVLRAGIDARGATIDDFRHVDGVSGSFQDAVPRAPAGRPGRAAVCGATIAKLVAAGRGTYVCETLPAAARAAQAASSSSSRPALGGGKRLAEPADQLAVDQ